MFKRYLALIVFFGLTVLLLEFRPNHDVDVFWRVKLGQLALEQRELVRADPFTATCAGEPVPPLYWLSEVFYAALYRLGSWRLLSQVNAFVFAGAFLVAACTVRRRETTAPANLLGMGLGLLIAIPHSAIRPQSFGLLGFALLLWIAQLDLRARKKIVLAAMVLIAWQNMHPSVPVAVVVFTAMAGAGWFRWLFDRRAAKPWMTTALALLAFACTSATPMGWHIFEVSATNARISRELGITEWMPAWYPALWGESLWFWVALVFSLVLLARVGRNVRLEDMAVFFVLAGLALCVYRFSLFFAVAMVPVWSRWLHEAATVGRASPHQTLSPPSLGATNGRGFMATSATVSLLLLPALILPLLVRPRLFDREIPMRAVRQLRGYGVRGVIYNYREWGGLLIWAGWPDWKVTIDGRLYLFPRKDWQRYREIARGRVPVAQVEQWYRPDVFFLRPGYHKGFIPLLRASSNWEEVYADENAVVFIRNHTAATGGCAEHRLLNTSGVSCDGRIRLPRKHPATKPEISPPRNTEAVRTGNPSTG